MQRPFLPSVHSASPLQPENEASGCPGSRVVGQALGAARCTAGVRGGVVATSDPAPESVVLDGASELLLHANAPTTLPNIVKIRENAAPVRIAFAAGK